MEVSKNLGFSSKARVKGIELLPQTPIFYPFIFATRCLRPLIFQIMNSGGSKRQSLKYQKFIQTGCKD